MQEEILEAIRNSTLFNQVETTNHCHGEDDCLSIMYYGDSPVAEKNFIKDLLKTQYPHWRIEKFDQDGPRTIVIFHERAKL